MVFNYRGIRTQQVTVDQRMSKLKAFNVVTGIAVVN